MKLFKNRHQFTCPDVIYLRNRQKKIAYANLGVTFLMYGGLWVAGKRMEKKLDDELNDILDETPAQ